MRVEPFVGGQLPMHPTGGLENARHGIVKSRTVDVVQATDLLNLFAITRACERLPPLTVRRWFKNRLWLLNRPYVSAPAAQCARGLKLLGCAQQQHKMDGVGDTNIIGVFHDHSVTAISNLTT